MGISGIGNGSSWLQNWGTVNKTGAASNTSATTGTSKASLLQQLGQDLGTGNLAAAQNDFASITGASGRAMNTKDATDFGSQLSAIGTSLQNGDLTGAQGAFQKLSQLVQSSGLSGKHHHHHQGQAASASSPSASGTAATDPFAQAFGDLGSALNSGDLAGAQTAFSQLQSLLQGAPNSKTGLPLGMNSPADPAGGIVNVQA